MLLFLKTITVLCPYAAAFPQWYVVPETNLFRLERACCYKLLSDCNIIGREDYPSVVAEFFDSGAKINFTDWVCTELVQIYTLNAALFWVPQALESTPFPIEAHVVLSATWFCTHTAYTVICSLSGWH
jgi:hypothetical protein